MKPKVNQNDLNRMIKRYVAGTATAEEILFIEAYYKHLDKEANILDQLKEEELEILGEVGFQRVLANINQPTKNRKSIPFYKYIAAAVVFIAFISGFLYFSKDRVITQNTLLVKKEKIDVLPGVDKAILTLSDGSKIVLDDAKNEKIVEKAGLVISKTTDGQLLYKVSSTLPKSATIAYNTIATSKGNQYQVLLPDGTKVWLNAASSLKYPEVFTGNERKVILSGEAYFEVAKNKDMPFRVQSRNQDVQVLGTHFNINSYSDDQSIKTTLLEGAIKVSNANFSKILKPGEQSLVENNGLGNINVIKNIDVDGEIAWKKGLFSFNNVALKTILIQLERWYDIKIDYQSIPDKRYNGMVPRKSNLSEVLNMLELTGNISFKIEEGRRLKVISK
jgi:hypothetical protein